MPPVPLAGVLLIAFSAIIHLVFSERRPKS